MGLEDPYFNPQRAKYLKIPAFSEFIRLREAMTNKAAPPQLAKELLKAVIQLGNVFEHAPMGNWQAPLEKLGNAAKAFQEPPILALVTKIQALLTPYIDEPGSIIPLAKISDCHAYIQKLEEVIAIHLMDPPVTAALDATLKPRLIVGLKDKQLTEEIIHQVNYFGYLSVPAESLANVIELVDSNQEKAFGAVLLDTQFCLAGDLDRLKILSEKVPIIFISHHHDVATRLFAVKAGGRGFLVRPLEFTNLIEKIDQLTTPSSEQIPYRILIVEDSRTQAQVINQHLKNAGMITEVLIDPLKINEALVEFQPDLILLDLYMPTCSGIDLARVIRQQDMFVGIPIVYLSAEEDLNKQLTAIRSGGDGFLTKPIAEQYLIDAVGARAQRSRTLRAEMIMDSLTETLNHTRILEQLELEIARAKRNKTALSFAMIDIDHFKTINDSHGHPVGDRVIKGLARLLKQRLRKSDSIGRYGGEEFAIILPQTEPETFYAKLDEIRRAFSNLLHRSSDPLIEFSATFSAGIAQLGGNIQTVDDIVQAADKALYDAKAKGRNCISSLTTSPN